MCSDFNSSNHCCHFIQLKMKFLDWYLKIGVVSALVGASMELFMIKTGFCKSVPGRILQMPRQLEKPSTPGDILMQKEQKSPDS
ncbi:hypothetical protein CR513_55151, partial [Mucuna pruriens]